MASIPSPSQKRPYTGGQSQPVMASPASSSRSTRQLLRDAGGVFAKSILPKISRKCLKVIVKFIDRSRKWIDF
jgi:hypothetical protein